MSNTVTQIDIPVPKDLTPSQRRELADLVIEHIIRRSEKGLDKDGKAWSGPRAHYSDSYRKSAAFKAAGKGSKVDLHLSGDMLAALQLLKSSPGKLRVGFEKGTAEERKAEGNILGTYGQSKPIPGKDRDFLGIEPEKLIEFVGYIKNGE